MAWFGFGGVVTRFAVMIALLIFISLMLFSPEIINRGSEVEDVIEMEAGRARITTLFDNYAHITGLETGWGFSCLIELKNETVLFDTGADSAVLLRNMERLGKSAEEVDRVVLSHIHGDHTGGLSGVLKANPNMTVYLLRSFPEDFKVNVKTYGSEVIEVSGPMKISESVMTTGELGTWIKEQSLLVKTKEGIIVITGCAHPGIVDIVRKAKDITNEEVYLVLGGFHLGEASKLELERIINEFRKLGVRKVSPTHCSGDLAKRMFAEEYGDDFIDNGVGKVIEE